MVIMYTIYKTHIAARNGAPDETYLVPTEKGINGSTQERYVGKIRNISEFLEYSPELNQLPVPSVPQSLPIQAFKKGKLQEQPGLFDDLFIVLRGGASFFCGTIEGIIRI